MTSPKRRSQRNPLLEKAVLANPLPLRRRIPKRRPPLSQLLEERESLLHLLLLTRLSLKLKLRPRLSLLKRSLSVDGRRSLLRSFLLLLSFSFSFVISASALGTANVRCEMVLDFPL